MKKLLYFAALLAATAGTLVSCNKNAQPSDGEGGSESSEFQLNASSTDIVLDESVSTSEVLNLTWSVGSNQGTGNAITYKFEMSREGDDWALGYDEDLGRNVYSKSYKGIELNALVNEYLGGESGVKGEYKIRVTAVVLGREDLNQSAEIKVQITPYEALTTTLYILGPAAKGWTLSDAPQMTYLSDGKFTWTGWLKAGELKFVTSRDYFWPGYVRDGSDPDGKKLKFFVSEPSGSEDLKFTIEKAASYEINVNIKELTYSCTESASGRPPYDRIYFVSDFITGFAPMNMDQSDPFIFHYGFVADKEGCFKFGTKDGSQEDMYKATVADAPFTSSEVSFVSGTDPDYKWKITSEQTPKAYKVSLNITPDEETMTCDEFTPYSSLWLIGDAAPHGWSLDDAKADDDCKMTAGEGKYEMTWTGDLLDGELKISCDLQSDWAGAWFMPCVADSAFDAMTDVQISYVNDGSTDRKWKVSAGNYTITLNQLLETITVKKN